MWIESGVSSELCLFTTAEQRAAPVEYTEEIKGEELQAINN